MASPLVSQGTLNRLRGSIVFPLFPELNITAPYLGPEGINVTPEGDIVDTLPTMTGTVTSPAPYQMYTVEVELLKTQSFSDLYKQQLETLATVGDFIIRPDAATLSNYQIRNASIYMASPGRLNGKNVAFVIGLRGYYLVNASLYDSI